MYQTVIPLLPLAYIPEYALPGRLVSQEQGPALSKTSGHFSPSTLHNTFWLFENESSSGEFPGQFEIDFSVLEPKCVESSAIRSNHLVVVGNKEH